MLEVGTGKAAEANSLLEALGRGREDRQYFSRTFLNRTLHDSQLQYVENAQATVNCLATSNRWGKTTVLLNVHAHACIYKSGGERITVVMARLAGVGEELETLLARWLELDERA